MNLDFIVHGSKAHQERVRAALDLGHANKATRTNDAPAATPAPAPVGTRSELRDRLGVTDPEASDEQLLAVLDSNLAAKAVTPAVAKRAQPSEADKLYALAWPDSTPKAAPTPTADDALYALAWGNDRKGA